MRRTTKGIGALLAALLLVGCNQLPEGSSAGHRGDGSALQTSSGDQEYWVEQVADNLKSFPSSMVWLPNGDMLIPERQGGLRVMRNGKLDLRPISGTPETYAFGLNGIKDILLDPDFQTNQTIYLSVTEGTYEKNHAAVYRAVYSPTGLSHVERIFRSRDELLGSGSAASRMMFLSDKTLLVGVPENDSYKARAQQLTSDIGKIVRLNRDGSIPSDNPFLHTPGVLPEIFSYGHRVALGLYQDYETQEILEAESGPKGGDELNVLKAGKNYGWAKASWGFDYTGGLAAPMQTGPDIQDPILVWTPSVTPSGLMRYRGKAYPLWDGDYFVGHLTTRELERLRIRADRVILQERMLVDLDERIRDVKEGPDGLIYILTDHQSARLFRLRPGRPNADQLDHVAHKLAEAVDLEGNISAPNIEPGDPIKGKQAFLEHCSGCHRVANRVAGGEIGPDLAGVYERNAGTLPGYSYSAALANSPQVWNARTLSFFIADPARYVPGTKMSYPPVTDFETRRNIIGFLKQNSGDKKNAND